MDTDRTLLEIFDRLAAGREPDIGGALHQAGFGELPADLLNQTLVSYCDTAPIEVAEHLAPHVTAVTAAAEPDPTVGLNLLASAPVSAADGLDFGAGGVADDPTTLSAGFGSIDHGSIDHGSVDHVSLDALATDHAGDVGHLGEPHSGVLDTFGDGLFDSGHDLGLGHSWLGDDPAGDPPIDHHPIGDELTGDIGDV